ncbi:hypothetical protein AAMO2058_000054700 [Amorphochlora amoebiformis]
MGACSSSGKEPARGPERKNVDSMRGRSASSQVVLHFPIFHDMDQKNRQLIRKLFTKRKFPKGALLFKENESKFGICVVVAGEVQLFTRVPTTGSTGDEKVTDEKKGMRELTVRGKGEWFGDFTLTKNIEFSPCSAKALTNVEVLQMTEPKYEEMSKDNPDFAIHILDTSPSVRVRLNSIPLFREIPEIKLMQLQYLADFENYSSEEVICKQGDNADGLYYIVEGKCSVSVPGNEGPVHLTNLKKGDWFGEIALLKETVRTANVQALTECKLLKMTRSNFKKFLDIFPSIRDGEIFNNLIHKRTSTSLQAIPIFSPLIQKSIGPLNKFDSNKLSVLGSIFRYVQKMKGEVLFKEDDNADSFYLIVRGTCVVTKTLHTGDVPKKIILNILGPNDWFGETSLLRQCKRTATVEAKEDTLLLRLDQKHFSSFLQLVPGSERLFQNRLFSRTSRQMSKVPFFSKMQENKPWSKLDLLGTLFEFEQVKAGVEVIKQGDKGDKFFIIVDGEMIATAKTSRGKSTQFCTLGPNDWFGEIALLKDTPRTASVTCKTDCLLLSITKEKFQKFSVIAPELVEHFQSLLETRAAKSLKEMFPFSEVIENRSFSKLDMVASLLEFRHCEAKTVILEEGKAAERFYFIIEGKVEVFGSGGGNVKPVKELKKEAKTSKGSGEYKEKPPKKESGQILEASNYFGEESIVEEKPSKFSFRSVSSCVFLTLSKVAFSRMEEVAPEVIHAMGFENKYIAEKHLRSNRLTSADFLPIGTAIGSKADGLVGESLSKLEPNYSGGGTSSALLAPTIEH